jgi:hypothetical protein
MPEAHVYLMEIKLRESEMPRDARIVAAGLLTQHDLDVLGSRFTRAYPVGEHGEFDDLLRAIDEADRRLKQECSELPGIRS